MRGSVRSHAVLDARLSFSPAKYLHFVFVDFVDGHERQRSQYEFTRALDSAGAAPVRERLESVDTLNNVEGDTARCVRPFLGDVLRDVFKVVGGVDCPTDAHQDG